MVNFSAKWDAFVRVFIEMDGYKNVILGLKNTVLIAVIGLSIGIVIGTLIAITKVIPQHSPLAKVLSRLSGVYVGFFRGTPMVVQLLVGYYVLLPLLGLQMESLNVCITIFGLNSAAYVSEIMRSGIKSVDKGQMEAGRALGMSYGATMQKVVMPQAVKNILPTLGNEFIALVKETSVVSFVGAVDLYTAFRYIGSNSYEFMVPYIVMALCYIVLVMLITVGVHFLEKYLGKNDKRRA